jgi:8-oxo-dGTP diphosphatase
MILVPKQRFKCPVAVHLILLQEDQILLMRRKNTGFADGMWALPAGCIDGNETVTEAMKREAKEEIGIQLSSLEVSSILHRKDFDWESIVFFFHALQFSGEIQNCEPHKCEAIEFFPIENLPNNLVPYVKQGIFNSLNRITFDEFGWQENLSQSPKNSC